MKNLIQIALIASVAFFAFGCSGASDEETKPKGPVPEIKQMEPGVVPPEQRGGRQAPEGGEGTR